MATKGELTTLTFSCPHCNTASPVPLRDFGSGTVTCPKTACARACIIPDNDRYRRLAREIDAAKYDETQEVRGTLAIKREPFYVTYRRADGRVVVHHVQTAETREIAVGHWNGRKGNMISYGKPIRGDIGGAVLWWLEEVAILKGTN